MLTETQPTLLERSKGSELDLLSLRLLSLRSEAEGVDFSLNARILSFIRFDPCLSKVSSNSLSSSSSWIYEEEEEGG